MLFLRDARGFRGLARGEACDFHHLAAFDFKLARGLIGTDAVGRKGPFTRNPGRLYCSLRFDFGLLNGANLRNLERAGPLVGGDTLRIDGGGLGDAGSFGGFARSDLGFLDRARAFDLAPASLFLVCDSRVGHGAVLLDARLLYRFAGCDFSFFDRPRALDVTLADFSFRRDPYGVNRALIGDSRLLDFLARLKLLFLDRACPIDLLLPRFAFRGDARLGDRLFVQDARLLDRLAGGDLGLFGFCFAKCALARNLRALQRPAHLDVTLLLKAGSLALAFDLECLPLGLQIPRADLDHRILFYVVAQLAPGFDVFHQPGQALRVKAVGWVEIIEVGLVEIGDGDGFQLEPVLGERLSGRGLDPRDILAALLMHLFHGHLGCDGTDGGDEFSRQERVQLLGF